MKFTIRPLAIALLFGAAVAANAQFIFLSSVGTATVNGAVASDNETVTTQLGGLGALSSLALTGSAITESGTGVYTGPAGNALDFTFALTSDSNVGNAYSFAGTWQETSGAGAYANTAGSGTLAITLYNNGGPNYPIGTVLTGDVSGVPEPASFAVLGVGAVALIRRRRKS